MEEPKPPENRNINTEGGNYNERIEGDYIQGNFFQNIFNILGSQQLTPVGNPAREHNQRLLLADVKQEVAARLRQSLHNALLINLGKEAQPQQVKRPWDAEIKIGLKPVESLPDTTTILEVFDSEEIAGKLLILGAPGSGKTTTQLELAQALIKRAEEQPDYPVPVLFNLSSWKDDRQSIADWLVTELKSKYGVSKKLCQEWVNNRQLLPLLDGLDELESQRQELCVQLINQFLGSKTRLHYLVICSRIEEYSIYSSNLHLNGGIYLREVNETQILEYFEAVERVEFLQILQCDEALLKLMRTPLFLSITVLSVQNLLIEDWQQLETMEERIEHLFDAYWQQQMFKRKPSKELYIIKYRLRFFLDKYIRRLPVKFDSEKYIQQKPPIPEQTRMWLVWLAQQMQRESKTEFLIEEMQPNWFYNEKQLEAYELIILLMFATIIPTVVFVSAEITSTANFEFINLLIDTISVSLFAGLSVFIAYKASPSSTRPIIFLYIIKPVEAFQINITKTKINSFVSWLIGGLFIGILCFLSLPYDEFVLVIISLIFVTKIFLIYELKTELIYKSRSNQGIFASFKNSFFIALILTILVFLIEIWLETFLTNNGNLNYYILPGKSNPGKSNYGIIPLISYPFFKLFLSCVPFLIALFAGGIACIQHFALRLILYFNGYIPWNYARFLDYCTERLFLQRVGGRYRFMHKMLQDHFAQMDFNRD
jgi:hypothetical protein